MRYADGMLRSFYLLAALAWLLHARTTRQLLPGGPTTATAARGSGGTDGGTTTDGGACTQGQTEACYSGPPSTEGIGVCKDGTRTCSFNTFGPCEGEVLPQPAEACDGVLDDNCDGTVDEGCSCTVGESRPCYGGPPGTEGVGICKGGSQQCENGQWGACSGAVLPGVESCNGEDDDCNGKVDDGAGFRLFSMKFSGSSWSTSYVSDTWTGSGAPPCSGIAAAVQLSDEDRLLVFGDDGKLYTRKNGGWTAPVDAAKTFPSLPTPVDAVYHIPHAWSVKYDPNAPNVEAITFTAKPNYYIYEYTPSDTATLNQTGKIPAADPPGPDRPNGRELWYFERMDLCKFGTPDAYMDYLEYDDGSFYSFDAAFVWKKWTVAKSPFWLGKANAPPVGKCVAGFFDWPRTRRTWSVPNGARARPWRSACASSRAGPASPGPRCGHRARRRRGPAPPPSPRRRSPRGGAR